MPSKIGFVVLSSSGHEDNFSAKELMVHAPTVNGWRSARFCSYPQQITLQLVERSRVRKLQLLAHQYLISAKVEFHIGDSLPDPAQHTGPPGPLHRLGYVSLSDNQKTGHKARELKSIHVNAVGTYLRVTLHRNHANRYNYYNQPSREQLIEHYLHSTQLDSALDGTRTGKCESISPLDDLAFDMYQDPEVAHIIRLLDQRKQDAARQERFELAKALKQAIADLQKVGELLGRYDVEKRSATEKEDYALAQRRKEQMDEYRSAVYQQLQVHHLLDMAAMQPTVSGVPYDDIPLPALRRMGGPGRSPGSSHSPGSTHTSPGLPGVTAEAEPLSQAAQREASRPVEVFGEGLNWAHRERALAGVCDKLQGLAPGISREERKTLVRAAVFLVKRALQDKLSPVFQAALRLLRLLLRQVIPGSGLGRAELSHCLEQTWPSLLARSWDPAHRFRATAATYILDMAQWKEVRALQVVPAELSRPLEPNCPTRLALGRAELLEKLLGELGTEHSGFTLDNVMTFCGGALEHSAAEVREVAVRVVLSVLFEAFARLDGGAAGTQQKGDPGDSEQEKEEIRSLHQQLAALKEEMSGDGAMTSHPVADARGGLASGPTDVMEKDSAEGAAHEMEAHGDPKEAPQAGTTEATKVLQNEFSTDEQPSGAGDLDNLCIFCGKRDERFTEDKLDLHYWKHCPMLRRCEDCTQVVEISSLTEHLLGECKGRGRFSQCPRCSEALPAQELARHVQGPACNPPGKGSNHCPLCHNNFIPGEEAWKAHLMGRDGCKQNSRRTAVGAQRTQPAQGKPMAAARLRQACSDGARSKAVNRTSRIPALAPRTTRAQAGRARPSKR
ncbi:hypothetical protein NHX12_012351 [Muraenolepis orangiensis]|uniref:Centrosomal protein 104 n=1 Tax=Muraenolepis orangiensis TaxID=630683 RepID=A0A9Q0DCH8_9TELE|nr:hypothetical protein NHX12_012351 [Muraenolepis orangiensis]